MNLLHLRANSNKMKKRLLPLLFLVAVTTTWAQESIIGFSKDAATKQLQLESEFEKQLSTENLDQWMQLLAGEPHWVGTEYGEKNVKWMEKQFKSWGYDTKVETYDVQGHEDQIAPPRAGIGRSDGPGTYRWQEKLRCQVKLRFDTSGTKLLYFS